MKRFLLFCLFVLIFSVALFAQDPKDMIYRRSSLNVSFIDDYKNLGARERAIIEDIIKSYKVSDKYNNHQITDRMIDLSRIEVSANDTKPYEKKIGGKLLDVLVSSEQKAEWGIIDMSKDDPVYIARMNKYIEQEHLPGYLVTKWFNLHLKI